MEETNKEVQKPDGQVEASALLSYIEERVCEHCWKLCSSNEQLIRHQKYYHDLCKVCGKFTSRAHLRSHMLTHSGVRPWNCEHCPKRFTLRCNLVRHARIHSGQKPFSCDLCDKCFNLKKNMEEHRLTHTKEKPFSCSQCGRKFARRSSLVRHARNTTHLYSRDFECTVCGTCCPNRNNLQRHITAMHCNKLDEQKVKKRDRSMMAEIANGFMAAEAAPGNEMIQVQPSPTLVTLVSEHSEGPWEDLTSYRSLTTLNNVPSVRHFFE